MVAIDTRKKVNSISDVDAETLKSTLSAARRTRKKVRSKIKSKTVSKVPGFISLALDK